jgi:hypothetical protein
MRRIAAFLIAAFLAVPAFGQAPPAAPPLPAIITLGELAAVIAERDRQSAAAFAAQQKAVDAALAAQDKATAAAFSAAEKAVASALAAQEKATAAAFQAANTAVSKAELSNEKRLDSVNEFRAQLKDQAATLATRAEVAVQIKALNEKQDALTTAETEIRARSEGATNLWTGIAAVIGLIVGLSMAGLAFLRHVQRRPFDPVVERIA